MIPFMWEALMIVFKGNIFLFLVSRYTMGKFLSHQIEYTNLSQSFDAATSAFYFIEFDANPYAFLRQLFPVYLRWLAGPRRVFALHPPRPLISNEVEPRDLARMHKERPACLISHRWWQLPLYNYQSSKAGSLTVLRS